MNLLINKLLLIYRLTHLQIMLNINLFIKFTCHLVKLLLYIACQYN